MTMLPPADTETIVRHALAGARDTRTVHVRAGARHLAAAVFEQQFGRAPAVIVADENTFAAAGRDVVASFHRHGIPCAEPVVFPAAGLYAESAAARQLGTALSARTAAVPVAVGSGTINDLTKLAAHWLGRLYMAVATAASMDGYTAFGASITQNGLKQTVDCPAPAAVLADLEVLAAAPDGLNASGYADLAAKVTAGADWLVADALGIEPVDGPAWETVHGRLRWWLGNPSGVRQGDQESVRRLTTGLVMGGFAMQRTRTSRPASGAEHQFSHLWDMQHHTHDGRAPSHGFKVGIGTLASTALYEQLVALPLYEIDVDRLSQAWADTAAVEVEARAAFGATELTECAVRESAAKQTTRAELRQQLVRVRQVWPELRERLVRHLLPFAELSRMLRAAGCPTRPEEIGISRERLRASYHQAYFIRRRFTVLDFARKLGVFDEGLAKMFGPGGPWAAGPNASERLSAQVTG